MAISKISSGVEISQNHSTGDSNGITGTIKKYDYVIIHLVSWHRSSASEPVLSSIQLYDNAVPTKTITFTQLSTQTRNEAIADGGYCTLTTFAGQYTSDLGDIDSGRVTATLTGPDPVDYVVFAYAIYRGVPYQSSMIFGTIDDNNGEGTSHDYGSITTIYPNAWINLFAIAWETTTSMGTYTLDDPTSFTSLNTDNIESAPGVNQAMFMEMWNAGPVTAGTITPSPDDSSTNSCQWMTVLLSFYAADSYPMDGGMGVFF